jgi:hypothetical protein
MNGVVPREQILTSNANAVRIFSLSETTNGHYWLADETGQQPESSRK